MRRRCLFGLCILLPAVAFALLHGAAQETPVVPAKHTAPPVDLTTLSAPQRLAYLAARRGTDWLRRTNKQDGKFVYGFLPDLRAPLEGDSYLAQAGATFALARAAAYFGDEASLAISRQALLTLLLETTTDRHDKTLRFTAAPAQLVNRLASHGQLVLAVHALPSPGQDLLEQADQLCNYVRRQQQADGSLRPVEGETDARAAASDDALACAGLALHGLMRSHKLRPAAWKPELAAKARAFAEGCWQRKKTLPLAVSHVPAFAETYLLTKEAAQAELAFAMADWLCTLQYTPADPVAPAWVGGFRPWADGRAVALAPDVRSAEVAAALAAASRAARAAGDLPRLQRYRGAVEACLPFLVALQYTEARTQHFVPEYRPALLGAFHASAQDGKIRIDYAQHALAAMVGYLEE